MLFLVCFVYLCWSALRTPYGIVVQNSHLIKLSSLSPRSVGTVSLAVEQDSFTVAFSISILEKFSKGISAFSVDTDTLFGVNFCFPHRPLWPLHGCLQELQTRIYSVNP